MYSFDILYKIIESGGRTVTPPESEEKPENPGDTEKHK